MSEWQSAAEAWNRWESTIRLWLGPATAVMLDFARIGTGSHVLDVAAGAGEPAITAARLVGATGRVVATDISSNILAFADSAARACGLDDIVETCAMDGENLELPEHLSVCDNRVLDNFRETLAQLVRGQCFQKIDIVEDKRWLMNRAD